MMDASVYFAFYEGCKAGFAQGAASRDAEVAELKVVSDHNLATYHQAAKSLRDERDELRLRLAERDNRVKEACAALCYEHNWLVRGSEMAEMILATKVQE